MVAPLWKSYQITVEKHSGPKACLAPTATVKATLFPPVFLIRMLIFLPTCPTTWRCLIGSQAVVASSRNFYLMKWPVMVRSIPHCRDFSQARQTEPACLQWTHTQNQALQRSTKKQGVCSCVCLLVCHVNCPAAEWTSINSTSPELTEEGPAPWQG